MSNWNSVYKRLHWW